MRLIFSFWERVTASNLCGGGQSTFGGKDCTYKKLDGRWCGFAALIRGGRPIRRLQLFVKALCHHYPDNPLACPCVDGHLSGGTLHSWNTSKLSVVSILSVFHTFCNVVHWGYFMNFELGKWRPTQRAAAAVC